MRFFKKFLTLPIIILLQPALALALETGDASVGLFGGYQKGVFSDEESTRYVGVKSSLYQPTLNWGDYHVDFVGFQREDPSEGFKLGLLSAEVDGLWVGPGRRMDALAGDGFLRVVTPQLVFEHLGLPGQSFRGAAAELQLGPPSESSQIRVGLQGGKFTEQDFLIPGAVETLDEDLAGGYAQWCTARGACLGAALDFVGHDAENRRLLTLYGSLPTEIGEIRMAAWQDSLSDETAGTAGLRQAGKQVYREIGFLHVPQDFNYLSRTTSLPEGQSLVFGTNRFNGVQHGYYMEGSGGRIGGSGNRAWLGRGSLGGYYRSTLRDVLNGAVNFSHREADSGRNQTRLRELLRYSHRKPEWDTSLGMEAIQSVENLSDDEPSGDTKSFHWIGEARAHYRSGTWDLGGRLNVEHVDRDDQGDENSVRMRIDGGAATWRRALAKSFVEGGVQWRQNDHTKYYGGGLEITSPLPWGLQARIRFRAKRDMVSTDGDGALDADSGTSRTTIDLFGIVERRVFWGRPALIIGKIEGTKVKGVGDVTGRVFIDLNGNEVFDPGEKPVGGALVRLDGGFLTTTDANGFYRFPHVSSGRHHLTLDPASFPIDYTNPLPEGVQVQLYPRDEKEMNWPLKP